MGTVKNKSSKKNCMLTKPQSFWENVHGHFLARHVGSMFTSIFLFFILANRKIFGIVQLQIWSVFLIIFFPNEVCQVNRANRRHLPLDTFSSYLHTKTALWNCTHTRRKVTIAQPASGKFCPQGSRKISSRQGAD